MTTETIHIYRKRVFYVSLAMIAVGFIGCRLFDHISHIRHDEWGNYGLLAALFFFIEVGGGFLCVFSALSILVAAVVTLVRRRHVAAGGRMGSWWISVFVGVISLILIFMMLWVIGGLLMALLPKGFMLIPGPGDEG